MRESFVFYKSFFEAIKDLPDNEQLQLYKAICNLALDEVEIELNGMANTLFKLIKPNIIANTEKWRNGNMGGRPKKPVDKKKKTTGLPNKKPNENGNEDVNENGNEDVNENGNEDVNENGNEDVNENGNAEASSLSLPEEKKIKDPYQFYSDLKEKYIKEVGTTDGSFLHDVQVQDLLVFSSNVSDFDETLTEVLKELKRVRPIMQKKCGYSPGLEWLYKEDGKYYTALRNKSYSEESESQQKTERKAYQLV